MVMSSTEIQNSETLLAIKNELKRLREQGILVTHIQENGRYKIIIERAASTKGVDGFKVEANGDNLAMVETDAAELYANAKSQTEIKMEVK